MTDPVHSPIDLRRNHCDLGVSDQQVLMDWSKLVTSDSFFGNCSESRLERPLYDDQINTSLFLRLVFEPIIVPV